MLRRLKEISLKLKYVLIAKPWRGGLAKYVFKALQRLAPGQVEWIPTRPVNVLEQMSFRQNRRQWLERLNRRICETDCEVRIFINHLKDFSSLPYFDRNVLWVTDGPNPEPGEYAPYGRIYVSDLGYSDNVVSAVRSEQFGGELGFAYCPETHRTFQHRREQRDLCFIGNKDPKRDPYVEKCLSLGGAVTIYGNYFLRHTLFWNQPRAFRPSVDNEAMGGVYAQHKLSMNIHARVVRCGTNMRTFECAGFEIPQLVEYRPGLDNYFELGKEIEVFHCPDEFVEKYERIVKDHELRLAMAQRALLRVRAEHSYDMRIKKILSELD